MHHIFNKAQDYARKSVATKINETVDSTLNKLPNIPIVSPIVNKVVNEAKKQADKKIRRTKADTDVLIIGAGISGVLMATKLKKSRPFDHIIILEKRQDVGGTWDLFNYPGIRSDSDISTFCFADRPWLGNETLAGGKEIKEYIQNTVTETDIKKYIRFGNIAKHLSWSSTDQMWTVTVKDLSTKLTEIITAKFIICASGYYDTEKGYQPEFTGQALFKGQIVHPQLWNDSIKYQDKKVVIIGSGATAITLLPALLDKKLPQQAKYVTMLQRSPSYIISVASSSDVVDKLSEDLNLLSKNKAYQLNRWRNILVQQFSYKALKKQPRLGKAIFKYAIKHELAGSDISTHHFLPTYNPWDERVCVTPDGEFFSPLKNGQAQVVTDDIYSFTKNGIQLASGKHLEADIIVTATGLNIQMFGGAVITVDDKEVSIGNKMTYKAVMLEDVPNMAIMFGYTNASWTLKIDLASSYVIKLLGFMTQHKHKSVVASAHGKSDEIKQVENVMSALNSGYVQRGSERLPKQGNCHPWQVKNNYLSDRKMFLQSKISDDWLKFRN